MTRNVKELAMRVDQLIALADKTVSSKIEGRGTYGRDHVNHELFSEFSTASLSFIENVYGKDHTYYKSFQQDVTEEYPSNTERGRGILRSIKSEIEGNWLVTMKGLISAEIFSNFIEMAEHLLTQKYKDAAAVMIGSVLEEHLRQLCNKHRIPIIVVASGGKHQAKKADMMNADLKTAGVYNAVDQKQVTAWLDLRNNAAHGKYAAYTQEQVELMLRSVNDFMARNPI
jgi:hypothetical protein